MRIVGNRIHRFKTHEDYFMELVVGISTDLDSICNSNRRINNHADSSNLKIRERSNSVPDEIRTIIAVDLMYEDMKSAVEQECNKDKLIAEIKRA